MLAFGVGAAFLIDQGIEPSTGTANSAAPLGKAFGRDTSTTKTSPPATRYDVARGAEVDFAAVASIPSGPKPPKKTNIRRQPRMPISDAKAAQLRREAMNQLPNPMVTRLEESPVIGGAPAGYFSKGPDFDGPNAGDIPGTLVPPDPELAVGPNHVVAVVNVRIHMYDKLGNFLGGADTDTFFGVAGGGCGNTFDPNVLYDEEEDRWVIGIDGNGVNYCVAFCQTSNPVGVYNVYAIPTPAGRFFDYPHAGLGDDVLVMGANIFNGPFEARVWAMDKNQGYAGVAMTTVERLLGPINGSDTPQPMNAHGMAAGTYPFGTDHYIIAEDFSGPTFEVWKWADPLGANTLTKEVTLNWPGGGGFPINSPTRGGQTLTGNDWRPQDAEYSDGTIWTTRHVSCNPGSGTRMCVGWAQVDLGTMTVRQGGIISHPAAYLIFPDIAANSCGDAVVGYSATNATQRPVIAVSAHINTNPLNSMSGFKVLKQGAVDYNAFDGSPHRWGDYTGATPDPDGKGIWYLGQISEGSNPQALWGTYIVSASSSCVVP